MSPKPPLLAGSSRTGAAGDDPSRPPGRSSKSASRSPIVRAASAAAVRCSSSSTDSRPAAQCVRRLTAAASRSPSEARTPAPLCVSWAAIAIHDRPLRGHGPARVGIAVPARTRPGANVAHVGSLAQRMVVTADAERRALERALHDGAQQRIAALNTTLALAGRRLDGTCDGDAAELVTQAGEEAKRCLEDLRDLARLIYPAVLAERGLGSALRDLAHRAAGFVEVVETPDARFPEPTELAAYLVASEALSNL